MNGIGAALRRVFSRDDAGIAVPVMDGVFKPNNRLEKADRELALKDVDNLTSFGGELLASSNERLHRFTISASGLADMGSEQFEAPITFVAATDQSIAIGLRDRGVKFGVPGNWANHELDAEIARCMTAAVFLPSGELAICVGSLNRSDAQWKHDLMEHGRSGCVILLDTETGSFREIATGLAYPNGVMPLPENRLAISESWRHRIVGLSIDGSGSPAPLLEGLPAYPARLAPATDGGFWLALFAPRRQLFEMVLRDDDYRREMIATIDPEEWIGPTLGISDAPDRPLQQGSVRQMGILKPWSPSPSYGLVARCGPDFRPLESFHSRADGSMHGVTSVWEGVAGVLVASKGSGTVLRLNGQEGDQT